jgi:hypothetical protein
MDYLYDELDTAARRDFETHLAECAECRQELEALQGTSQKLQTWEVNPPPINLTFVNEKVTGGNRLREWFNAPGKIWGRRLAFGLAAILVIFSLTNFELSVGAGRFDVKMSLLPRAPLPPTEGVSPAQLADFKTEQLLLMQQLVTTNQAKQRQEWTRTFIDFAQEVEQQRKNDLKLVGNSFERLQFQTDRQILQTHQSIDGLMRVMQVQAPGGR